MTRASDVAELVLGEIRASTGAAFSGVRYREEPLLFTGAQRPGRTPARIGQMRDLARKAGWHSFAYGGAKLFYEQARFMEDFEDDCPYTGQFERYYPTYEDMSDRVLRGYFTWRARYRAGRAEEAPLSFLFVYAYELLCGIGVQPGPEGYRALGRLQEAYGAAFRPLELHVSRWRHDYAVYHQLPEALPASGEGRGTLAGTRDFARAVSTLRRAEQGLRAGVSKDAGVPDDELFGALSTASRYRIDRSAALRLHQDELVASCVVAFASLVEHCRRRRKEGFVDGAFGKPTESAYRMFSAAVFFDPAPPAKVEVDLGFGEGFFCRNGQWFRRFPCRSLDASVELGNLLHAVDAALRERVGDVAPLKSCDIPAFLQKMAVQAVEGVLARKAAEEAARVTIDRTSLAGIRSAAAVTCESLLVDEEREDAAALYESSEKREDTPVPFELGEGCENTPPLFELGETREDMPPLLGLDESPGEGPFDAFGLSPYQVQLLHALLAGGSVPALPAGTTLAMEVDAANEALFDLVGDVCIEFDGDDPRIVEEYRDDLTEALQ